MSMDKWKEYVFNDFVSINPTISLKKNGGNYSYIEMKDLSEGKRFVSPSAQREITGGARFRDGNTLFARITPCLENGKIGQAKNLVNDVGFGSTEFLIFEEKPTISDKDFVYYLACWQEVRRFAEQNMVGTSGRQRVGKEAFNKLQLSLPPLLIQKQIASILSSLDEKIELNRQTNQTLEAIAQTLFKEMCLVKGDELPEGWKIRKFDELINVKHGYAFKGEYFSDNETNDILVTPGNFKIGGGFNYAKFKYHDGTFPLEYVLNENDLVVTMTDLSKEGDTLGYPALIPTIHGKRLLHNQRVGKIEFKEDETLKHFLYFKMIQNDYRSFVLGSATGTTVRHTSPNRICDFSSVVPDNLTLLIFSKLVEPLLDKILCNYQEVMTLETIRNSILPKMMRNEISANHSLNS